MVGNACSDIDYSVANSLTKPPRGAAHHAKDSRSTTTCHSTGTGTGKTTRGTADHSSHIPTYTPANRPTCPDSTDKSCQS